MSDILSRLGLHIQSVLIYRDLVEHGGSFLQEISGRTQLERMTIYRRIPELIEKHLIYTEQIGKRFRYRAHPPSTLREMLTHLGDELDTTIGSLERSYHLHAHSLAPIIRVDQGIRAIEAVYIECVEMLPVGGIYYRYSSRSEKNLDHDSYKTMRRYNEKRDQKKIQRLVITNEDLVSISTPKIGRETLAFPSHFPFKQNFQKLIYADRVALIDLESLTVYVTESKLLASFEEAIFTCLFQYIRAEKEGRI